MKERLVAFAIWAAVAASAVFWGLRLGTSSPVAPAHTVAVAAAAAPRGDLTRLFGAAPVRENAAVVVSPLASRFRLLGVAAPRQGGDRNGLALIAVDGKPARSYAVGAPIDGDMVLQAVHARGARLGAMGASAQVMLELPALPPAATGTLPAAQSGTAAPRPPSIATLPAAVRALEPPQPQPQPQPQAVESAPASSPPGAPLSNIAR
jgi:general secretion pathway protein C